MPPWPRPLRPRPPTSLKPLACCRRFLKLLARKTRHRSTNRIRELNDTISRLPSLWASTNRIPRVTWIELWSSLDARPRFWPEKWRLYQLELIILPSLIVRDRERQRQRQTERELVINSSSPLSHSSSEKEQVITSGSNAYGQLGHAHSRGAGGAGGGGGPAMVPKLASVSCIACGDTFTIAATKGESLLIA